MITNVRPKGTAVSCLDSLNATSAAGIHALVALVLQLKVEAILVFVAHRFPKGMEVPDI